MPDPPTNVGATSHNASLGVAFTPPANKEAWVAIEYRAEPVNGIYFRTPEMGYKPGDTHMFSQGEQTEARGSP